MNCFENHHLSNPENCKKCINDIDIIIPTVNLRSRYGLNIYSLFYKNWNNTYSVYLNDLYKYLMEILNNGNVSRHKVKNYSRACYLMKNDIERNNKNKEEFKYAIETIICELHKYKIDDKFVTEEFTDVIDNLLIKKIKKMNTYVNTIENIIIASLEHIKHMHDKKKVIYELIDKTMHENFIVMAKKHNLCRGYIIDDCASDPNKIIESLKSQEKIILYKNARDVEIKEYLKNFETKFGEQIDKYISALTKQTINKYINSCTGTFDSCTSAIEESIFTKYKSDKIQIAYEKIKKLKCFVDVSNLKDITCGYKITNGKECRKYIDEIVDNISNTYENIKTHIKNEKKKYPFVKKYLSKTTTYKNIHFFGSNSNLISNNGNYEINTIISNVLLNKLNFDSGIEKINEAIKKVENECQWKENNNK